MVAVCGPCVPFVGHVCVGCDGLGGSMFLEYSGDYVGFCVHARASPPVAYCRLYAPMRGYVYVRGVLRGCIYTAYPQGMGAYIYPTVGMAALVWPGIGLAVIPSAQKGQQ